MNFTGLCRRELSRKKLQDTFGDFKTVDSELRDYVRKFSFAAIKLSNPPKIEEHEFTSHALSMAETDAELAGYHLCTRDLEGARRLVEQALKRDPKVGLAHEEMGFLHFADGNDSAAQSEFAQASALDPNLFLSLFAKTMLSPIAASDSLADQPAFESALRQVLKLNPQFAPAYIQLARIELREGEAADALRASRKAEELEPSRAGYHLQTGHILLRMGQGADAARFAKFVADRWTGPDHDEAVELWNEVSSDQRPAGEVLIDMIPKDSETVSGIVQSVQCAGAESLTLLLSHGQRTLTFHRKGRFINGFSDTLWYGADHYDICHHVKGLRAIVRYYPAADTTYAGDLAEVEIRNDLPMLKNAVTTGVPRESEKSGEIEPLNSATGAVN